MRGHFFNYRAIGRLALYIGIAIAILTAAVWLARQDRHLHLSPRTTGATTLTQDALQEELVHCQALGTAAKADAGCINAWAKNRQRFLGEAQ